MTDNNNFYDHYGFLIIGPLGARDAAHRASVPSIAEVYERNPSLEFRLLEASDSMWMITDIAQKPIQDRGDD